MESQEKSKCMMFMGYKVQDMTREGLLEVIKYQWWDKGLMDGKCEVSPELDHDKIAQKELPSLPRKEVISIQPGDVIVLNCNGPITTEFRIQAEMDLKAVFRNNQSVILHNGMTLEVYREQEKVDLTERIEALEAELEAEQTLRMEQNE